METYFKLLTKTKGAVDKDKLTEKVSAIYGSVTLPKDFDYKSELEKAINEKHNV